MSHPLSRKFLLSLLAVGMALSVSAATWVAFRHGAEKELLPVIGSVPRFALTTSSGSAATHATLAGDIWIADFIFTQCPGVCPRLSEQMRKLQKELERRQIKGVRLVSISVDPKNDTPAALAAYAQRYGADEERWLFLTGERDQLHQLVRDGFHLAVAERTEAENTDGEGLITHSDRLVLIDANLKIRAYYRGLEPESIDNALRDIDTLQRERS